MLLKRIYLLPKHEFRILYRGVVKCIIKKKTSDIISSFKSKIFVRNWIKRIKKKLRESCKIQIIPEVYFLYIRFMVVEITLLSYFCRALMDCYKNKVPPPNSKNSTLIFFYLFFHLHLPLVLSLAFFYTYIHKGIFEEKRKGSKGNFSRIVTKVHRVSLMLLHRGVNFQKKAQKNTHKKE